METFIHTIDHSLTLSTIAFCLNFDGKNNYLILGNGSTLNFYQFNIDIPILKFNYHLFGDIALLIPYYFDGVSILIVILSSNKYCIIHNENGRIICDQNGEIPLFGSDIGQKYSYSLYQDILLLQISQENLQLFKITNKKLVFIQSIGFYSPIVHRFELINTNQFISLQNKSEFINALEIYNFDVISHELNSEFNIPKNFNNFLRANDNNFLVSKEKIIQIVNDKYQTVVEFNLNDDIFDIVRLRNNLFLVVTFSGEILTIRKKADSDSSIEKIGEVCKPLKLLFIDPNHIVIPSRYGETKYFCLNGMNVSLKTLFTFPGKVTKFVSISKRLFFGLSQTNHIFRIEKTICMNDLYEYKFDMKNRCWFIDDQTVLFSNEKETKILNFLSQNENKEFLIQRNEETIDFHLINENEYIQITKNSININNERLNIDFLNISIPKFSNSFFTFCEDLTHIFVMSFNGEVILHHEFPFQINSIALFEDEILAVSSWEEANVLLINIKESNEDFIDIIHEFTDFEINDLLFINKGEFICALSTKNNVYFFNSTTFSIRTVKCEGIFYKLNEISENEIIISGEKTYLINDQITTELYNIDPFIYCDSYEGLLLFCGANSLSIKEREKVYKFQSKTIQTPFKIIDAAEFDENSYSILFENREKEINLAISTNIIDFNKYKKYSLDSIQKSKVLRLITVIDIVSKIPFILILNGMRIDSLSIENSNQINEKSTFKFYSKPIGLINIENNVFCVILIDKVFVFSLEEGTIIKLSSFYSLGATYCFCYLNKKLILGDLIDSIEIYELQDNKTFTEKFRQCNELSCSSCIFIDDDNIFLADQSSFLYKMQTSQVKNYASSNLRILKSCSLGSAAKAMMYCPELECTLIGSANGEIIECKDIESFEKFQCLFDSIEKSVSSIGGFQSDWYRKLSCNGYFLGIPRIFDADLLKDFLDLNEEQKIQIFVKNNLDFDIEIADFMCNKILNSL